jgi:hypothetical protein
MSTAPEPPSDKTLSRYTKAAKSGNVTDLSSAVGVLQTSLTSIGDDAKSMASTSDSVAKAFWQGVEDGFEG